MGRDCQNRADPSGVNTLTIAKTLGEIPPKALARAGKVIE
jgi:hypothetical protein